MKSRLPQATTLDLCREAKVSDLLGEAPTERFEASGIVAVDDTFYVIFDNRSDIGCFGSTLVPAHTQNRLIAQRFDRDTGYEDIACDPFAGRFFILIESLPHEGGFLAKVREYDGSFRYIASAWLEFPVPGPNKGFEGLACVWRAGRMYLLGLCEGNGCKEGKASRQPGAGRIQVFAKDGQRWGHVDTIPLPPSLPFKDYSSMAVSGERLCVVSQESSALWVGSLSSARWRVTDDGDVYQFPRTDDGKRIYGNVEGVSWLSDTHVVVVSDKAKPDQKRRTRSKDQSIHVFALPAARGS